MKLEQIKDKIAENSKISKAAAGRALDLLITEITNELVTSGRFRLGKLGVLKVKQRNARTCRSPQTGADIHVPARKAPTFTASRVLKDAVNQ